MTHQPNCSSNITYKNDNGTSWTPPCDCQKEQEKIEYSQPKKIPCDCPKGGLYEREDGSTYVCQKCNGSQWVSQPKEEWEEFDEEFVNNIGCTFCWYRRNPMTNEYRKCIHLESSKKIDGLKSFISQLLEEKLAEQREESDRELEKMLADKKAHYELREKLVIKEVRAELLKEIEEKLPKKVVRLFKPEISEGSWVFKALEEGVQKIIKKQK